MNLGQKLLIIDNEKDTLELLREVLENEGYKVRSASNGKEGLERVEEEKPHLIISDIMMSPMGGHDLYKMLQKSPRTRSIPFIFLSVRSELSERIEGLELGADDYLTKPFTPRELLARVKTILERNRQAQNVNPLTGLPGNILIEDEVEIRIKEKKLFAFLYMDLDNFKAFNDHYGFKRGDLVLLATAEVISQTVGKEGGKDDFVGHIGGDDFVAITSPEKAEVISREIIKSFDRKVPSLYDDKDKEKGHIEALTRMGKKVRYPIMTISIGIATNEKRSIENYPQLAEIASEVKKKAKESEGSQFLKDRRTG